MSFWRELKRRNVYEVGAAYLVGAWLCARIVDIVVPIFEAPLWVGRTALGRPKYWRPLAADDFECS